MNFKIPSKSSWDIDPVTHGCKEKDPNFVRESITPFADTASSLFIGEENRLFLSLPSALQMFGPEMGSKTKFFMIPTLLIFSKDETSLVELSYSLLQESPHKKYEEEKGFSKNLGQINLPGSILTSVQHLEISEPNSQGKMLNQTLCKAKTFPMPKLLGDDRNYPSAHQRPNDGNCNPGLGPSINPNICDVRLKNEKDSNSIILKIKNISPKIKKSEILEAFFGHFAIISKIVFNQAFGYAFLQLAIAEEAECIIRAFDGRAVFGSQLRVSKTTHSSLDFGKFSKNGKNKYEFYESVRSFSRLHIDLVTKPLPALTILVIRNVPSEMDPKCFAMVIQQVSEFYSMSVTACCGSKMVSYNVAFKSLIAGLEVLAVLLGKKVNSFTIYHL